MVIKSKNWQLSLLAFFLISLFCYLGYWQLSRAHEKKVLLQNFALRLSQPPLAKNDLLKKNKDLRFYRVTLTGRFDNKHIFLLDNKIFHGRVGYEVYTPFITDGRQPVSILVDRGFVPASFDRKILPKVPALADEIKITGLLNIAPKYLSFGDILDNPNLSWPLRIEYIDLPRLEKLLSYSLHPYVLSIEPKSNAALQIEWQILTMGPEKHLGYALQWFAFAATLLILFFVLKRGK